MGRKDDRQNRFKQTLPTCFWPQEKKDFFFFAELNIMIFKKIYSQERIFFCPPWSLDTTPPSA